MRYAFLSLAAVFAAACNNGGSSASPTIVRVEPTVQVTAMNAVDAAQACVRAALDIQRVGYVAAKFLRTPIPEPPMMAGLGADPAVITVTLDGPAGGTAEFSWSDHDGDLEYTSGDEYTITLDDYGDQGVTLRGAMLIRDTRFLGVVPSPGTWIATANIELLSLHVLVGTGDYTLNTTLPIRLENRQDFVELFDLVLPEDLVLGDNRVLQNNRMSRYENNEMVTLVFDGAVHSTVLDGVLTFATSTVFAGFPFFANPTDGLFTVHGTGGSSMEIQPMFFQLELRVDEDGDGEFEDTQSSSWMALLPQ